MTASFSARCLMWTLWPSFVVAGAATGIFFSLFDTVDLHLLGEPIAASRLAVYTIGFLGFWAVAACAVWLALLLARPCMMPDAK